MDAAEYKHVVLGLIFRKSISDSFEVQRAKLLAGEGDDKGANPEDPDEYKAENVFWVPEEARWSHLRDNAKQPTIGKLVDDAMVAIERDNPRLKGVLPKDYARPALDQQRLGELIDVIATIELTVASEGEVTHRSVDLLGRVYEYFLNRFASAEGKNGGQFYTPSCVVRCLVGMLEPYKGRIYDPCCGSGGMFVQSEKFVESHGGKRGDIRRALIEADLVDCMVALPGQLFYSTQIPVCLWFLAKSKAADSQRGLRDRCGETLFIAARKLGPLIDRVHRELLEADLEKISGTVHRWRGSGDDYEDVPGFCKSASTAEIADHGHVLTPGRYVGDEEVEEGEPFEEKMPRLVADLERQFAESAKLEATIMANLKRLNISP